MGLRNTNKAEFAIIIVLFALASTLILSSLGRQCLWQDEAQTACISKTVLTHGIPLGFDGRNYFSQEGGVEYRSDHIWRWHTWLPFYVTAAAFKLFGISTFTARLPFALFGIATVLLAYFFARSLWKSRRAGVLAAIILMTNVPFLILVRQCRYYSLTMFFALASLYAYSEMMRGRKYASWAFVLSSVLLFHSFYVYLPPVLAVVLIHAAIYHRNRLKQVLGLCGICAALSAPWMIYVGFAFGNVRQAEMSIAMRYWLLIKDFASEIFLYVLTPWLLLAIIAVIWTWIRARKLSWLGADARRNAMLAVLFTVAMLIVLIPISPRGFFRYIAPLVPVLVLMQAGILDWTMKRMPALGLAILLLLPAVTYTHSYVLCDYAYELTHEYNGPIDGIVKYLKAHVKPGDLIAVNHEDLPIKFYIDARVMAAGTGENLDAARNADWFVSRLSVVDNDRAGNDRLYQLIPTYDYEEITLDSPDSMFENREDPDSHSFRTPDCVPPVLIYRRRH